MDTLKFVEVGLPTGDDKGEWKKFWISCKEPWRTEPRISKERQQYLSERLEIKPDIKQGIYPFKDIHLSRADVEWLLSTHDNHHGPVNWNDESQREREGLDLRGADLSNEDLSRLPLAKLRCGINGIESFEIVRIETPGGNSSTKSIKQVGVFPIVAQLQRTKFDHAQLQGACLDHAQLQRADFYHAELQEADLNLAELQGAVLSHAQLQEASLERANLQGAFLSETKLQGANIIQAQLQGADLWNTQLQGADLWNAQLQGVNFTDAQLQGAKLGGVTLADENNNSPQLADVQWGDTNLAVVDWSQIIILGDEYEADQKIDMDDGKRKVERQRISEYKKAARAYRQLSVALRNQGINEDASRFAYRAQLMQRKVFWYQHKFLSYFGSHFLDRLSGYGYKFGNAFLSYFFVIAVFAAIYFHISPHLAWYESIVISMTAFHGRGFFPTQFNPGDPQAIVAAIEAFVGLFIEITLIAMLTQRLFGK
jgi:uncharacterized protein YjbI with pentapeptide repeats